MTVHIEACMPLTFVMGGERSVRHDYALVAVSNMYEMLTYGGKEIGKFTRGARPEEIYRAVEAHASR